MTRIQDTPVRNRDGTVLSQTVEYALRAVVLLASEPDTPKTVANVAAKTLVPPAYLAKILRGLTRAGLVASRRGLGGGVTLVRPPEQITIKDVVDAVEPLQRIRSCPLGLKSHGVQLCPLHARLDSALASVEAAFSGTTLAEIIAEPTASQPLCDFPSQRPVTGRQALPIHSE
jgi:Rrf2 family transcriptional regulator, nitric oxide-sensitive transcriptional repressor